MVHSISPSNRFYPGASGSGPVARQSLLRQRLQAEDSTTISKLLMRAGILSPEELLKARQMADLVKASLDSTLLRSAYIAREYREDVCRAADFVERGMMSEELAAAGLRSAMTEKTTFEQGLKYHGWGW